MQRRPFIKLLGISLGSIPIISSVVFANHSAKNAWNQYLDQLLSICPISLSSTATPTPQGLSNEFLVANNHLYEYSQGNYYFQVFEQVHPTAGVLDLMIPFWKRQASGQWEKIACWSLFDLRAVAQASLQLKEYTFDSLFPTEKSIASNYRSNKGEVRLESYLYENNNVITNITLSDGSTTLWESRPLS